MDGNYLYHLLSGTLPFGFSLFLVIFVILWALLTFLHVYSDSFPLRKFFRTGLFFTFILFIIYMVLRVQYRLPPEPVRWWVHPFTTDAAILEEAEVRFAMESCLEKMDDQIVAFQTRYAGVDYLQPVSLEDIPPVPEGAKVSGARRVVVALLEKTGDSLQLTGTLFELNRKQIIKDTLRFKETAHDPIDLGRLAANRMLSMTDQLPETVGEEFNPTLSTLFDAESGETRAEKEKRLLAGFAGTDSSDTAIWEKLALLYLDWRYPAYKPDLEHSYQRLLALQPKSAIAHYCRGMVAWRTGGQLEEAFTDWKLAYLYDPHFAPDLVALSWLPYAEQHKIKLGGPERILRYAVSLRPFDPEPRVALIKYYRKQRTMMPKAIAEVDQGFLLNPEEPRMLMSGGVIYLQNHQNEDAIRCFRSLLAIDSTQGNGWYNLGIALRNNEQTEEAIHAFNKALENGGPVHSLYYLGVIYETMGDFEKALTYYRKRWSFRHSAGDKFGTAATRERMTRILHELKRQKADSLSGQPTFDDEE